VVVSGFHPVREVLERRPRSVEALLVQRGRKDARAAEIETLARTAGVPVRLVAREELDRLAGRAHNGVAARVAERDYDAVEDCLAGPKGGRCVLFLDEVTDPGNLGSVLRTAAAVGASVVLTERHSAPLNEAVAKVAAGALERVKVGRVSNAARFLEQAKGAGFWIYGAAIEGENLWEVDISGDAVLCMGSEGTGLRRLTRETCDRLISLPMRPAAGSLNVSVAAGVLLYEWIRRMAGRG
jgi:23S rRNA (guanosine2251-2'-O)-methyltransferase